MKTFRYILAWISILSGIFSTICWGIFIWDNLLWLLGIIFFALWIVFIIAWIWSIRQLKWKDKQISNTSGRSLETSEEMRTIIREDGVYAILSQDAFDLLSSLSQVDISNITSITFIPTTWKGFIIKNPNIKKLAIYITTKLGKTTFKEEELRKAFDHVVTNISSDLSKTDFDLIQGKISEFVRSGGEVKIEKYNP